METQAEFVIAERIRSADRENRWEAERAGFFAEFDSLGQILRVFESADLIRSAIKQNEEQIGGTS